VTKIQRMSALFFIVAAAICPMNCGAQVHAGKSRNEVGIAVKISSLGAGAEVGVPLGQKFNVRGGFNALSYSRGFDKDGIHYAGNLSWRSGEANLDWFPFGGRFRLSPGLLLYNGNKVTATSTVPGGKTFTLNNVTYTSKASDPVHGTGNLDFTKAAPTFRIGFGNLIPRREHHWSILAEAGVAYQGSPRAALTLGGTICDSTGLVCGNAATDPNVQSNLHAEQAKINKDLSFFRFYPLLSFGVGYSF
jgi:hypothetical protein